SVRALPLAAVKVRARTARRHEHEPAGRIRRDRPPRVRGARLRGAPVTPRRRRRIVRGDGDRIEAPYEGTRASVVTADDAALHVGSAIVSDRRAHDDDVAAHGWRR